MLDQTGYRRWICILAVVSLTGDLCLAAEPSRKKGFCTVIRDGNQWREKITALNVSWFYSWGPTRPESLPDGIEFTPMIWGKYNARRPATLQLLKDAANRGEVRHLLGFNEPDQLEQSNMSVQEVLSLWPNLMETGLPLASPSCVHPDREWMKHFMAEVESRKLRVDYVCVHSYGGANANALVDRLTKVHEMYGRPIWITEFAVGDWTAKSAAENKYSPKQVAKFMREVLPKLDSLDFVHRYAWYSAAATSAPLGTSALFNEDGTLTRLGEIYRDY
ncbi:MAG: glycoside hydrolase family protein [Planctomycetota bacterium]